MANQLSVAHKQSILTLYSRGISCRRIAHDLGLDRGTVRKYELEAHGAGAGADGGIPKPATIAPTGSEGLSGGTQAAPGAGGPPPGSVEMTTGGKPGTPSNCLAHRAEILAMLDAGPSQAEGLAAYNGPILREKISERFGKLYTLSGVYALLHRLEFNDLMPRPTHPNTDPAALEAFKKKSCPRGSRRSGPPTRASGS